MTQELEDLAAHQTRTVEWALHTLGRALLAASVVGLAAAFVIGVLALPLAGLVCAVYLLLASAPVGVHTGTDGRPSPLVAEHQPPSGT